MAGDGARHDFAAHSGSAQHRLHLAFGPKYGLLPQQLIAFQVPEVGMANAARHDEVAALDVAKVCKQHLR